MSSRVNGSLAGFSDCPRPCGAWLVHQTSGRTRTPSAPGSLASGVAGQRRWRASRCCWRVSEQKGVLFAAAFVFLGGRVWRALEVLAAGGSHGGSLSGHRRALSSWSSEEEGAIAGVLVQVVVRLLVLSVLGGQRWTSRNLSQFVSQVLQLLSQLFQGVRVVCRDGVGESLKTGKKKNIYIYISLICLPTTMKLWWP